MKLDINMLTHLDFKIKTLLKYNRNIVPINPIKSIRRG